MASLTPSEYLATQLYQHFNQTTVTFDKNMAVLEVRINDRFVPITIHKMGLQDTIQSLRADQVHAMADHVIRGIDQIKGTIGQGSITHAIAINLDANTIAVNEGEAFSIDKHPSVAATTEHKEAKDPTVQAKQVNAKARKAVATKSNLETQKLTLTKEKGSLEMALKKLATVFTESSHDKQKESAEKRSEQIEKRIEELNTHLQRVQEQLDQVSMQIDSFRDELAGLKQTSLLISIFQQVKQDNFRDFFGFDPATPPLKIQ